MKQAAAYRQCISISKQPCHADSHHNKSDLGERRTCQRPLDIHGIECQQRAEKHCNQPKRQNQGRPLTIMPEYLAAYNNNAKHTCLRQNTRQKRGSRRRRHRMRFRQPNMKRKHACLSPKTKQKADTRRPQKHPRISIAAHDRYP